MKAINMPDHASPAAIDEVRASDPLSADGACRSLPAMNARGDVAGVVAALRNLVPDPAAAAAYSTPECLAAMRDLGLFLGSLKRHGVEPAEAAPEVVPVLLELGRRTDMISRDTVHHYTTWNPQDGRRRMYTGDGQEAVLQDAVRLVFPQLRAGLEICERLGAIAPAAPRFASLLDELAGRLGGMVDAIDRVVEHVSPVFFARTLRPYFEGVVIDGKTYLGPAAAQVPLWLIDQAVWASDRGEPEYREFLREAAPYSLPRWRGLYASWSRRPSLVTRLASAYGEIHGGADAPSPALRAAAEALAKVLRVVVVFRGRHLGVARQAYQADLRLYPVGSGGGSVDFLRQVLTLTLENARMVRTPRPTPEAARGPSRSPWTTAGAPRPDANVTTR